MDLMMEQQELSQRQRYNDRTERANDDCFTKGYFL
jgi:hypothetical protein